MYAKTRKGKLMGIFQIGICPTLLLILGIYLSCMPFAQSHLEIFAVIIPIFLVAFGLLGYGIGPLYIPKRTMRKLLKHYFNY